MVHLSMFQSIGACDGGPGAKRRVTVQSTTGSPEDQIKFKPHVGNALQHFLPTFCSNVVLAFTKLRSFTRRCKWCKR